jgi:hypothetical protein
MTYKLRRWQTSNIKRKKRDAQSVSKGRILLLTQEHEKPRAEARGTLRDREGHQFSVTKPYQ